jgi:hypothetical protein
MNGPQRKQQSFPVRPRALDSSETRMHQPVDNFTTHNKAGRRIRMMKANFLFFQAPLRRRNFPIGPAPLVCSLPLESIGDMMSETEQARGSKYLRGAHRPINRSASPRLSPNVHTFSSFTLRSVSLGPQPKMTDSSPASPQTPQRQDMPVALAANEEPTVHSTVVRLTEQHDTVPGVTTTTQGTVPDLVIVMFPDVLSMILII